MKLTWVESARSDLRAIDRKSARMIVLTVMHYANTGEGEVKALSGQFEYCFRLRVGDQRIGDHRISFLISPSEIIVLGIRPMPNAS